jgi:hypothetical protein
LVNLIELTNAIVDKLVLIPDLVAALAGDTANIIPYIDENPNLNSVSLALYKQKPGSVMVIWQETLLTQGDMEAWMHQFVIFVRAVRGASPLDLIDKIINGIPVPGDGLRWRYCPVMPGVLPANITDITRPSDTEGIDYHSIVMEIKETGDA